MSSGWLAAELDADEHPVTVCFASTLSALSVQVLRSLTVALPGQNSFVLDLSLVSEVLPGALAELIGALRWAAEEERLRVSFSSAPWSRRSISVREVPS